MGQFVTDFEKSLDENAETKERQLYSDIKKTLEAKIPRKVDLEAIFTVIDGIINYDNPENLGMLALYLEAERKKNFPKQSHKETCKKLKSKFQNFIKDKCSIPNTYSKIERVYKDFFSRMAREMGGDTYRNRRHWYNKNWTIFTTNYDTCLEYYWCEVVQADFDTNFMWNNRRKISILQTKSILAEPQGIIKLFKLHGSINWLVEGKTRDIVEVQERGRSFMGRDYTEELMLYPLAEKELYLEPYVSMLVRLNRELNRKKIWIVVGYSFNDPVIREIFIKNWLPKKHQLILVHPEAGEILAKKLGNIEGDLIEKYFGLTDEMIEISGKKVDYRKVNHQIIHKLKKEPKFSWNQDPS